MIENIKILEDKINKGIIYVQCGFTVDKAIENLIKGYRELEEENKRLKYSNKYNVVSKYKIRKKIEELEKQYKQLEQTSDFIIADVIQPKIEILQELLKGGEV